MDYFALLEDFIQVLPLKEYEDLKVKKIFRIVVIIPQCIPPCGIKGELSMIKVSHCVGYSALYPTMWNKGGAFYDKSIPLCGIQCVVSHHVE